MRLVCPNCDAEYQVDDAAIPESGRDVQCSNCGHAWFQQHADAELAQEAEDELFGAAPDQADVSLQNIVPPVPSAAAVVPDEPDAQEPAPRTIGTRQTLAESVLSVLREEAERETAVRRDEAPVDTMGSVEMQPELGLDASNAVGPTSAAARHIARLKGTEDAIAPVAEPEPKTAARRDLLPDIEEINSTLRANSDRAQEQDAEIDALPNLRPRRSGFRSGFVLMMILAVVLAMAYIMAPRIIAQMPGAAPTMRAYVGAVDRGRLWLDGVMQSASGSLRNLTGDAK